MAIEQRNYDPAIMYGAQKNMTVDLGDVLDANENEILEFDAVASAVNFLRIANSATGSAVTVSAQGDDTNVALTINSLLTGALTLDSTSTGSISIGTSANAKTITIGNTTGATALALRSGTGGTIVTSADDNALTVGANGATNPVLQVNASTGSVATGVSITGAAAASRVSIAALSSGTNEGLDIDAKGSGTIRLGNSSTGDVVVSRALASSAAITSSSATGGLGYATGAGGAVTQLTNKSTGVTLNTITGQITMNGAALAADAIVSFVLTNSAIAANDILLLNHHSVGTVGSYVFTAQPGAGSATINVANRSAGSLSEAIVIQYAVIKAVAA